MSTLSTTVPPVNVRSGFVKAVVDHPVAAYFTLAYAGTWLLVSPLIVSLDGLGILHFHVPSTLASILFLLGTYTGPTLAAFLVTGALDGRAGVKKLLSRYVLWKVNLRWFLIATLGFVVFYLVLASAWLGLAPFQSAISKWQTFFTVYLFGLLIFPALITWGEEPGWRGFALTRMQQRFHPVVASLILGLLHGVWHLPIFIMVRGPNAAGPFNPALFGINTIGVMVLTIIWTWVFNNARQSILIAVLLHASLNASQGYVRQLLPAIPPQLGIISYGIFLIIALVIILATRGRLGYQPGSKAENSPETWQDLHISASDQ